MQNQNQERPYGARQTTQTRPAADSRSPYAAPIERQASTSDRTEAAPVRRRRGAEPPKAPKTPVWQLVMMDALLIGVGLLVFALFHHVLPTYNTNTTGIALPTVTATTAAAPETLPPETVETVPAQTDPADTTAPAEETTVTETTTAAPISLGGMFGDKFADKFNVDGSVQKTDTSYRSGNINVTLTKVETRDEEDEIAYFVIDCYVRDLKYFRTAFANDTFGHGNALPTPEIAVAHNAIAAISGDYCTNHNTGVVIRNGELFRDSISDQDLAILFQDGTMRCYDRRSYDLNEIIAQGAYQSWNFGPRLLDDNGQPMTEFNSNVNRTNPRCAIGYVEPGHYMLVCIDGRQPGYSLGMTTKQMSQLFYDLGCKAAFNLDGGQSSEMAWYGEMGNSPYNGGRSICDIIYVTDEE